MTSKQSNKSGSEEKQSGDDDKTDSMKSSKAAELENIRRNLARRSLDVKFDLQGSDYKPIENIGIGAYGVVCSAIHTKSGDRVAIKKIPSVFEALSIAKRTYREIKILKHFKHDNIISIREILRPKQNVKDFKDIYVVFDLMESDLHRIIYSKQELSEEHIQYFLYQVLRGLKYIHSANVIHRDLKPSNILVNEDCHLRIGDFGMARGVFYTPNEPSYYMTQYVATRWYRAPEILLSMLEYGAALDMWSVGCIFAEMMGRKHLFPGKDYISQVKLIVGVLGTPSEAVLKNCHHDILKKIIKSFGKKEPISWGKLFPKASKKSLDLVSKMLVINPVDRISVDQALSHRLLNSYHDPSDEPICVPTFNFDFEKEDMDKPRLRSVIMEEIMGFHQPKQSTLSFNAFLRPAPKSEDANFKVERTQKVPEVSLLTPQDTSDTGDLKNEAAKECTTSATGNTESKPSTKISPVSVDIGKLHLVPSSDIEMLSAKSADGRAMESQHEGVVVTDNKEMMKEETQPLAEDKKVGGEKDSKVSADRKGVNTISEDTRALVKQARLIANQRRQRAESQGDEPKESRPITAAQRQREREERRRKKKERALEKVKKSKDKKGGQEQSITLSNEDRELLRRWTVMQNPGNSEASQSPPHPGPAVSPPQAGNSSTSSRTSPANVNSQNTEASSHSQPNTFSSQPVTIGSKPWPILAKPALPTSVTLGSTVNITTSQSVVLPSTQLNLSQANFIPVIAIPSLVNPGHLEIKRIFQPTNVSCQTSVLSLQATDNAKNLMHAAILLRNQNNSNVNTQNITKNVTSTDVIHTDPISHPLTTEVTFSQNTQSSMPSDKTPTQVSIIPAQGTKLNEPESVMVAEDDKHSHQSSDILDYLNHHLKDSPGKESIHGTTRAPAQPLYVTENQCMQDHNSFMLSGYQDSQQHTPPRQYTNFSQVCNNSSETLGRSNSTPTLLRQTSHSSNMQRENAQRSSVPVVTCGNHSFSNFEAEADFSESFHSSDNSQPENFRQPNTTENYHSNFISQNNYQNFSQTAPVINFDSQITHPNLLFQNASQFPMQIQPPLHHQVFSNSGSYEFQNFTAPSTSRPSSSMQFDQSFSDFPHSQTQQQGYSTTQGFQASGFVEASGSHILARHLPGPSHPHAGSHSGVATTSTGSFSTSMLQQNGGHMASGSAIHASSHPSHRLTVDCSSLPRDSNSELITLLTKQLSKQHVMDIVPSLALTPRGTGAGYGVGMDLDTMLTDAQDHASVRAEQSPLSSSLLADWLDISENISQADLEALERELSLQSPMYVSYNDVNL